MIMPAAAAAYHRSAEDRGELDLIGRIRAGDDSAFECLFATHYDAMCAVAYTVVRSRDAAGNIASSVLRAVWERRREWQPTSPMRGWLLRATRDEALALLRRIEGDADRRSHDSPDAAGSTPRERTTTRHLSPAVVRALHHLPPRCRAVLQRRWCEGLGRDEIAHRLNMSAAAVERHLVDGLRHLQQRLNSRL